MKMTAISLIVATSIAMSGASAGPTPLASAHQQLWDKHIDRHGLILDFVGDLPTPEDCALGKPNAIGWWSPIENGPMFTGLYLPAMCERARRSGDDADKAKARRLAEGLLKCASTSDVPGFIARGFGSDGTCHYPMGSDDQTHPWFLGLHVYVNSGIPSQTQRAAVVARMKKVADVLESTGWRCPCDGAFKGDFRGGYKGHLFRDAVRYLYLLRAMHDVTGDEVWLRRYQSAAAERPAGSDKSRLELCALGYPHDRDAIKNIDQSQLWIYVGCQASLARLAAMEKDEAIRKHFMAGLEVNAAGARPRIADHAAFDNADAKVFGNADWRAVYFTWRPQKSQADAEALARVFDATKRGERKPYESRYVRNPRAAAAIVAMARRADDTAAIEKAIAHYDYSRLNMAEFFFAEVAYYAMPAAK